MCAGCSIESVSEQLTVKMISNKNCSSVPCHTKCTYCLYQICQYLQICRAADVNAFYVCRDLTFRETL